MARMRLIKPGFFVNETLGELDPLARLLFIGLWCIADREGRLEDRPKRIKAEVLPYDDGADADALLQALHDAGFILRYETEGCRYVQIVTFAKHQSPHVKEASSTIPAPGKHGASTVQDAYKPGASTMKAALVADAVADADADRGSGVLDPDRGSGDPINDQFTTTAAIARMRETSDPPATSAAATSRAPLAPLRAAEQEAELIAEIERRAEWPPGKFARKLADVLTDFADRRATWLAAQTTNAKDWYDENDHSFGVRALVKWWRDEIIREEAKAAAAATAATQANGHGEGQHDEHERPARSQSATRGAAAHPGAARRTPAQGTRSGRGRGATRAKPERRWDDDGEWAVAVAASAERFGRGQRRAGADPDPTADASADAADAAGEPGRRDGAGARQRETAP